MSICIFILRCSRLSKSPFYFKPNKISKCKTKKKNYLVKLKVTLKNIKNLTSPSHKCIEKKA